MVAVTDFIQQLPPDADVLDRCVQCGELRSDDLVKPRFRAVCDRCLPPCSPWNREYDDDEEDSYPCPTCQCGEEYFDWIFTVEEGVRIRVPIYTSEYWCYNHGGMHIDPCIVLEEAGLDEDSKLPLYHSCQCRGCGMNVYVDHDFEG